MRHSNSDLIVPFRDRRKHRRILTLKNFGFAVAIGIAAYAGLTIESNLRHSKTDSGYGNLYNRQLPLPEVKAPEIVTEAPSVAESESADPMLVGAAAREQLLRAESNVPPATVTPDIPAAPVVQVSTASVAGQSHVAIVGGTEGVTIVKDGAKPPVLGGGFGRE